MKNNTMEDIFKNRLHDYPTDFDIDKGWSDLEKRLDRDQKSAIAGGKKRNTWPYLLLGLLLLGAWIGYKNLAITDHQATNTSKQISPISTLDQSLNPINIPIQKSTKIDPPSIKSPLIETQTLSQKPTFNSNNIANNNSTLNQIIENTGTNQLTIDKSITEITLPTTGESLDHITSNDHPTSNFSSRKEFTLTRLPYSELTEIHSSRSTNITDTPLSIEHSIVELPSVTKRAIALSIVGGYGGFTNKTTTKQAEHQEFANIRSSEESALDFHFYGLQSRLYLSPKWSIGIGIEKAKYFEKFSWKSAIDTTRILEDVVTEMNINSLSGDTSVVIGNLVQNGTANRLVENYNTTTQWNLPLFVGYEVSTSRMVYGIDIGADINLSHRRAGMVSSPNNSLTELGPTSEPTRIGLGLSLSPKIGLQLNDGWQISSQLRLKKSLVNWLESSTGLSKNPLSYGISLGLQKLF